MKKKGRQNFFPLVKFFKKNQEKEGNETGFLPVGNHKEETHIVNLADFIGVGIWGNRDRNCKELRQYLPSRFNINTNSFRREQLIPFIAKACAQSGFKVSTKGWEKPWQKNRFFANILVLTMMTVREPPLLFLHLIPLVCDWKAPM
jgi:hypothetical protein